MPSAEEKSLAARTGRLIQSFPWIQLRREINGAVAAHMQNPVRHFPAQERQREAGKMQWLKNQNQKVFSSEDAQNGRDKAEHAKNPLIPEGSVWNLEYVDVSGQAYCVVKRVLDMVLATLGIALLLIPSLVIAAAIWMDDPGTVIFSQYRVGRFGKQFRLYKFRTMKMDTPEYVPTAALENPDRYITDIGRILRKYSLDELPQLFNVLKGDMSLIGPRPLIPHESEIHQMRMRFGVYNIHPGITGLAQVNGRDRVSPADKVRWDVRYLQEFSFLTDLHIFLETLPRLSGDENVVEGCGAFRKEIEGLELQDGRLLR